MFLILTLQFWQMLEDFSTGTCFMLPDLLLQCFWYGAQQM